MKISHLTGKLFLLLFLGIVTSVSAENSKKNSLDKPLNTNNSLLWQISGNGLQQASYLFGTIHVINQNDYFLGKNVKKKIQKSENVILEVDYNNMDIYNLATLSVLDSNKTIKDFMSDSDYVLLKSFMEDTLGIKKFTFENAYSRFKPFYLESLIFINYMGREKESYEQNIKKIAEDKNIPLAGLESFKEQLAFIDQIPLETQLKSIVNTINNYTTECKKLDELIENYKAQDISALTDAFDSEDPEWRDKLVNKRNTSWIPGLVKFIKEKPCFIAVGAGHLGGENGLIQMIKKQGYTIEPIAID